MKKFLVASLMVLAALPALAQHGHHGHYGHRHYGHGGGWVAPLILGGVVTYALTRPAPQPVIVQQPPVVVQQQPQVVYIDNVAYTKQWMQINGQWQEVLIRN